MNTDLIIRTPTRTSVVNRYIILINEIEYSIDYSRMDLIYKVREREREKNPRLGPFLMDVVHSKIRIGGV